MCKLVSHKHCGTRCVAPRRGPAAGEASRRDRWRNKKTCRGRVFLMALIITNTPGINIFQAASIARSKNTTLPLVSPYMPPWNYSLCYSLFSVAERQLRRDVTRFICTSKACFSTWQRFTAWAENECSHEKQKTFQWFTIAAMMKFVHIASFRKGREM